MSKLLQTLARPSAAVEKHSKDESFIVAPSSSLTYQRADIGF